MVRGAREEIKMARKKQTTDVDVSKKVTTLSFPPRYGTFSACVVRVVDGDTIDIGFLVGHRVRIKGMNAPERGQPGYTEAKNQLEEMFPPGTVVKVECSGQDKYGRTIASVEKIGTMV